MGLRSSMLVLMGLTAMSMQAAADWSKTSILMLNGDGYKVVDPVKDRENTQVLTVEHVNEWKYGSNFFFFDVASPNSANSSFYGEFSPSLSLSKITGYSFSFGAIKDVSLTGTWEMAEKANAKLFGLGFDFSLPGFPVATMNVYQRQTESSFHPGKTGNGQQVTLVWLAPFSLGSTQWAFEGFLDYATAEKEVGKVENIVSSPRLMMDIGALWGAPKKLHLGLEYSYFKNKYGIKGLEEGVPQLALKWDF